MREQPADHLSQEQFEAHFQSAAPALWCVAASVLGSRDGAEDAVQDAALQAIHRRNSFRVGTDFTAWMAQIVRYTALNLVRSRRRGPRALGDDLPDLVAPTQPEKVVSDAGELIADQAAFDDRIACELQELSEMQRTCLLLRSVTELSYREIGAMLEIPENTAMSHVHRARQQLVVQLGDRARSAR